MPDLYAGENNQKERGQSDLSFFRAKVYCKNTKYRFKPVPMQVQSCFRLLEINFLISIMLGMAFCTRTKTILVIERGNIQLDLFKFRQKCTKDITPMSMQVLKRTSLENMITIVFQEFFLQSSISNEIILLFSIELIIMYPYLLGN